jgi:putative phosphoribosyl transferase
MVFQNREEAGQMLAKKAASFIRKDSSVCALARGGAVVGKQISQQLKIPLSVLVVKKLRAPQNPELAVGAVTNDGVQYIDWDLVRRIGMTQDNLDSEISERIQQVQASQGTYNMSKYDTDAQVLLVDDGIATGATVLAAHMWLGKKNVKKVMLAVPVIARNIYDVFQSKFEAIIALVIPSTFESVGQYYKDFPQYTDEEVKQLL